MPLKRQLEVMLADAPGELAKLTAILKDEHVNIEAMSIQDANEYLLGPVRCQEPDWTTSCSAGLLRSNIEGIRELLDDSSDHRQSGQGSGDP